MDTIFDCGEIGFTLYHIGHLNWRKAQGETPPKVRVLTLPDRMRMFEGGLAMLVETIHINALLSPFLVRNNFLYNGGPDFLEVFRECNIEPNTLIHGWENEQWRNQKCYKDKMLFKPFKSYDFEIEEYNKLKGKLDPTKKNIVMYPRHKSGPSTMEARNWKFENWEILLFYLIKQTDYNIIICGKRGQTQCIDHLDSGRLLTIVTDNPFSMNICALNDPNTILTLASQSFGGKLALLQNVDTVMWGDQKQRHQVDENWSTDPNTICQFIEDLDFSSTPEDIFEVVKNHLRIKEEG